MDMSIEVPEKTKLLGGLEPPHKTEYQPDFSFLGMIKSFSVLSFIMLFPMMGIAVMFPTLIELPLSWYMSTDVTHTADVYAYKPGATSTEYNYLYRLNNGNYEKLNIIIIFALPAMFYTSILVALANIKAFWKALASPRKLESKPLKFRLAPLLFFVFSAVPFFIFQIPLIRNLMFN
jgi:hypothetical protein